MQRCFTPHKTKGLESWLRVCREVGGPLSNSGLAAAVLRLTQGARPKSGACYGCGQMGHLKKACPNLSQVNQEIKLLGFAPDAERESIGQANVTQPKMQMVRLLSLKKASQKTGSRAPVPRTPKCMGQPRCGDQV